MSTPEKQRDEMSEVKSISHALRVLNEAAKEGTDEVKKMITDDIDRVRDTISVVRPGLKRALQEIREASTESVLHGRDKLIASSKEAAAKLDESAHQRPWRFVAGAALAASLLGFFLGRKSNRK